MLPPHCKFPGLVFGECPAEGRVNLVAVRALTVAAAQGVRQAAVEGVPVAGQQVFPVIHKLLPPGAAPALVIGVPFRATRVSAATPPGGRGGKIAPPQTREVFL